MLYTNNRILCCLVLALSLLVIFIPVQAFTANSLDITVDKNGDAIATFRFSLEGIIENAIPQSVLEEELKKGLTTSSEPPELKSMDRSSAVLLMKKFAVVSDQPTGTGYLTGSMDFKKAEIALQNSALSSAVSADFSPEKIVLVFPDSYQRDFSNVDVLPSVFHIVIDPSKTPATPSPSSGNTNPPVTAVPAEKGSMNITSLPLGVKVYLDSGYIGEAPALFPEIASGTHTVEFRKESYKSLTKNVTIIAGKTTNVLVVLEYIPPAATEETQTDSGLAWIILVIVLIAAAGGGYYYWSEKKKDSWNNTDETVAEGTGKPSPEAGPGARPAKTAPVIPGPVEKTPDPDPEIRRPVVKVSILKDVPEKKTGTDDPEHPRE